MNLPYLDMRLTTSWVLEKFHHRQSNPATLQLLSSPPPKSSWWGVASS